MAELVIRKATAEDVAQIEQIEKLCFATPWSYESLNHDIENNPLAIYLVAEQAGEILGYVGTWMIYGESHITNVAVSPNHRRQHVGSLLIETLIQTMKNVGITSHTLEVRENNAAAQKLYAKYGFEAAGKRKGYYDDTGEDAIIMWLGPRSDEQQ